MAKTKGSINSKKGYDAEMKYAKVFKNLGFSDCIISRYESKVHDSVGIDLLNLPFNVQIKAGKQYKLNPSKVLSDMAIKIAQKLPKESEEINYPSIVIHQKELTRKRKRNDFDEIVHMSFSDFKKLLNLK